MFLELCMHYYNSFHQLSRTSRVKVATASVIRSCSCLITLIRCCTVYTLFLIALTYHAWTLAHPWHDVLERMSLERIGVLFYWLQGNEEVHVKLKWTAFRMWTYNKIMITTSISLSFPIFCNFSLLYYNHLWPTMTLWTYCAVDSFIIN